jgi:hypothetical protein
MNNAICKISYNGRIYLACYPNGNISYSYEGINWNVVTNSSVPSIEGANWNGSFWLCNGSTVNGTALSYSQDGINWTGIARPVATGSYSVCGWNGAFWVFIARTILINNNPSGQGTWTTVNTSVFNTGPASQNGFTLAWNGKIMVASGPTPTSTTSGNIFAYSPDGVTWTGLGNIIYETSSVNLFNGKTIWNGKYFINCYGQAYTGNSCATSYDGINWLGKGRPVNRPVDIGVNARRMHSVTFQRNMTLCYGTNSGAVGNIMIYSLDGINWNPCNANFSYTYTTLYNTQGIAYNGKLWVSISNNSASNQYGNTIAASRDGINWYGLGHFTNMYFGRTINWLGNKWFYGGWYNNLKMWYSYDGFTWIPNQTSANSLFHQCSTYAYNGSIYVVGGTAQSTYSIAYSYDGINWTGVNDSAAVFGERFCIVTNGKIFVSNGTGTYKLAYSYDGINWTGIPYIGGFNYGYGLATNGTMFVSTSSVNGGYLGIGYSYDGITWLPGSSSSNLFSGSRPFTVTWNGTVWIITGQANTTSNNLGYSYNGINWIASPSNNMFTGNSTATCGGLGVASNYGVAPMPFIQHPTLAFGSGQNTIAYSPDGISWTGLGNTVFSTAGYCGFWSGSFWVAGGQGGNTMAYSYDGIQWTGFSNPITTSVQGIAYNGVIWVATGSGTNNVAYSVNGLNWTGQTLSGYNGGNSVYWNGTVFMIISNSSGSAYHSTDGKVWNIATSTTQNGMPASNGFTWVICTRSNATSALYYVNTENPVTTSYIAITPNPFSTSGNCVCYGGFVWIAGGVGTGNTLAYSLNGFNWTGLGTSAFPNGCSSICWNGTRYVGGGKTYIGYSSNGTTWYSGQTGLFTSINFVVSNPGIGAFAPPSAMVLNNNGITGNGLYSSTTLEVVSSDPYFQSGFTNVSFNITSNSVY